MDYLNFSDMCVKYSTFLDERGRKGRASAQA